MMFNEPSFECIVPEVQRHRNLKWYTKRLSVMGPMELLHRLREQCALKAMQIRHHVTGAGIHKIRYDIQQFSFCAGPNSKLPDLPWSFEPNARVVEELLDGRGNALGFEWKWKPGADVWHEAPDTGRRWPRSFFASIPYRGDSPYGDIRVAWEPSRLQHLVLLGLLARNIEGSQGDQAAVLIEEQLLSWAEDNPMQQGIHYISAMECALRILAVCYAVDLARKKLAASDRIWQMLLDLIQGHANFIKHRLSLYSSTGNHTITECTGLVYAGTLFPEFDGAELWKYLGLDLLCRESNYQIEPDGGGTEQAFWYLQFIVDLYGLVVALLEHKHHAVPPAIRYAHTRGKQFLNKFSSNPEALPSIGDSDNGFALSPFLRLSWDECRENQSLMVFEDSGYSMIRGGENGKATFVFDHGSLGMAPSYGHGHADALSVILRHGQEDILIDSGTYRYNGDVRWRAYFRGTRAHNTVMVDGLDQAMQETAFMWSHPFHSRLIRHEETRDGEIRLLAYHNGYSRLKPGVEHWRAVVYHPPGLWLICDHLAGEGSHTLDLHWHCGIQPIRKGNRVFLTGQDMRFSLMILGGDISLHFGEENPIFGWRSRMYGIKEPISTIRARYCGLLPYGFVTQIQTGHESSNVSDTELLMIREWINGAQKDRNTRCAGGLC
jgi:hypothetical protein